MTNEKGVQIIKTVTLFTLKPDIFNIYYKNSTFELLKDESENVTFRTKYNLHRTSILSPPTSSHPHWHFTMHKIFIQNNFKTYVTKYACV